MADGAPMEPAQPEVAVAMASDRRAKRKQLLLMLAVAVAVIALLWLLWSTLIGSRWITTDNAYVGGDVALVTPLINGQVVAVDVSDTQQVKKGQVLVRLSDDDARVTYDQALADLGLARRRFEQMVATGSGLGATIAAREADIAIARSQLTAASAAMDKAEVDFQRRQALSRSGAVSADEVTISTNALAAARAELALSRARVQQAIANRRSATEDRDASLALTRSATVDTSPEVAAARARLDAAKLDLERTVIRAPIDGLVTRRQVQVGQRIAAGAQLMTIVPIDQLYVDANFKESQLARVRVGQAVRLTSLLYGGGVEYHGKVAGLAGGTGAAFALIPAQNATGNWIRITQRLPVRIMIDPTELRQHPLRIGLSMDAEIRVR